MVGAAGPAGPRPAHEHHHLRRADAGHLRRVQPGAAFAARGRVRVRLLRPAGELGRRGGRELRRHQVHLRDVGAPRRARGVPAAAAAGPAAGVVEQGVQLDGVRRRRHRRRRRRAGPPRHPRRVARHHAQPRVGQRLRLHARVRRARAGFRRRRQPSRLGAPRVPLRVHVQQPGLQVQPNQRQRPGPGGGEQADGTVQGRGDEHHGDRAQPGRVAGDAQRRGPRGQRRERAAGGLLAAGVPRDGVRVREPARRGRQLQAGVRVVPGPAGAPREERRRRRADVPAARVRGRGRAAAHRDGAVAVPEAARDDLDAAQPRVLPPRRRRRAGQRRRVQAGGGPRRRAGQQGGGRAKKPVPGARLLVGRQEQLHGQGHRRPLGAPGLRADLIIRAELARAAMHDVSSMSE